MMSINNANALQSNCSIQKTPSSGRGIFATGHIDAGVVLLNTGPPAISVIHRPYRREVCARCFDYDRGKFWPYRENDVGLVFCSSSCQRTWRSSLDSKTLESYECVEAVIKRKRKSFDEKDYDDSMINISTNSPSENDVVRAWADAAILGQEVVQARAQAHPSKTQRRFIESINSRPLDPSSIAYLHAGLLCSLNSPERWSCLIELHKTRTPYLARALLSQHIDAYLHLLAVLPLELIDYMTTDICMTVASRDAHNAFGIRSLDDDGDELFGHGVWPEASYWNHSCEPNVSKKRQGDSWVFSAGRHIEAGEELCITYLGGDEQKLGVCARNERLSEEWGFSCACTRCKRESSNSDPYNEHCAT